MAIQTLKASRFRLAYRELWYYGWQTAFALLAIIIEIFAAGELKGVINGFGFFALMIVFPVAAWFLGKWPAYVNYHLLFDKGFLTQIEKDEVAGIYKDEKGYIVLYPASTSANAEELFDDVVSNKNIDYTVAQEESTLFLVPFTFLFWEKEVLMKFEKSVKTLFYQILDGESYNAEKHFSQTIPFGFRPGKTPDKNDLDYCQVLGDVVVFIDPNHLDAEGFNAARGLFPKQISDWFSPEIKGADDEKARKSVATEHFGSLLLTAIEQTLFVADGKATYGDMAELKKNTIEISAKVTENFEWLIAERYCGMKRDCGKEPLIRAKINLLFKPLEEIQKAQIEQQKNEAVMQADDIKRKNNVANAENKKITDLLNVDVLKETGQVLNGIKKDALGLMTMQAAVGNPNATLFVNVGSGGNSKFSASDGANLAAGAAAVGKGKKKDVPES